jgi:thioredoxin reductase
MSSSDHSFAPARVAVLGAGPIGVEAAFEGARRGHDVALYEAGRVGEHLRRYEEVTLFTPFAMNASAAGRERLRATGAGPPPDDAIVTAGQLVARYLEPMARLPELRGRVHERVRVRAVARAGLSKSQAIPATGDTRRALERFLIHLEPDGGPPRYDSADVVIDATGVYGQARATGPGGLDALGERSVEARIDRHLVPIRGGTRERYAGRRVLLIGDGHSAATALIDLDALAAEGDAPRVTWIRRARGGAHPFHLHADDPLPERASLAKRANEIAARAPWLTAMPGAVVHAYQASAEGVEAVLRAADGTERRLPFDQVLSLVGYRPDATIHRELQIHLCYASEGPMALATALLAAATDLPRDGVGDCLRQTTHGAATLRTTEPGYYLVGAKSYGRNPQFLLSLGHRQIADVFDLIAADRAMVAAPNPAGGEPVESAPPTA